MECAVWRPVTRIVLFAPLALLYVLGSSATLAVLVREVRVIAVQISLAPAPAPASLPGSA